MLNIYSCRNKKSLLIIILIIGIRSVVRSRNAEDGDVLDFEKEESKESLCFSKKAIMLHAQPDLLCSMLAFL